MLAAWGALVHRRRGLVLACGAAFLAASLVALAFPGPLSTGDIEGLEAGRAQRRIETTLELPGDTSFSIVFSSATLTVHEPRFESALRAALAPLQRDARVARVLAPVDLPDFATAKLVSHDGHHALAVVELKDELRLAARQYPALKRLVDPGPLTATFTGYLAFKSDLDATLEGDLIKAELVSVPLALLVLVWVFGSLVSALLTVLVGALAVLGGVGVVLALAHVMDMPQYAVNVVSLIGLGVAIDDCLFLVSRYRDARAHGLPIETALQVALTTSGRAVLFSGLAVAVGLAGLFFFPRSYLSAMGLGGVVVVLFAVGCALTVLPALLSRFDAQLERGQLPIPRLISDARWSQLATGVMRRPVLVLVPTLALLVALGAPFVRLSLASADVTVLPRDAEARRGVQLLREHFPGQASTRLLVAVQFPPSGQPLFSQPAPPASGPPQGGALRRDDHLSSPPPSLSASPSGAARAGALFDLTQRLQSLPGVASVEGITTVDPGLDRDDVVSMLTTPEEALAPTLLPAWRESVGKDLVLLQVLTDLAPSSDGARALVREVRARRAVADGTLEVAGQTARDVDGTDFLLGHAPLAVLFVVLGTTLLLLVALRSIVLPVKAVLMNLLSISASFGALVFVFQQGHGAGLLGFEPRAIEPTLPVLLFCCVFGLSMDYEVFLLSRMREEWLRTADNTQAVAYGLAKSAGLITSAAAIMVSVFVAFAFTRVVLVQAMGLGMALAVALDATLVRVLIVPAAMRLFGDLNWWFPGKPWKRG